MTGDEIERGVGASPPPIRSSAEAGAPGDLRILGFEIGHLETSHQFIVITAILFFFTLLYGYLQELVSIYVFERNFGLFVTLLQFLGYTVFAVLSWLARPGKTATKLPYRLSITFAVLQASMQGLSNLSMTYLNYPAKVLFKSSRVLPTMLFGVVFYGKRHTVREFISVMVLVVGLTFFMAADAKSSPAFDPTGVVLIVASLILDAGIVNLQEHVFGSLHVEEEEMILVSYAGGSLVLLILCFATGELQAGLSYLRQHARYSLLSSTSLIGVFVGCGFGGLSCVTVLTKKFGAVTAVLTTTTRKALTLLLSFVFFPKPFTMGHLAGIVLFIAGLLLKPRSRRKHPPVTHALIPDTSQTGGEKESDEERPETRGH